MRLRRIIINLVAAFTVVSITLYVMWSMTPLYAFQAAGFAYITHDLDGFEKRVDIDGIVDNLFDDLLSNPARSTPRLSSFQREVCRGAIGMVRGSMVTGLKDTIRRQIAPKLANVSYDWSQLVLPAAYAAGQTASVDDFRNLLNVATKAAGGSLERMKQLAHDRMWNYVYRHPETLPGKVLGCAPEERGHRLKELVNYYGLTRDNFKGISGYTTTSDGEGREKALVGFVFYSPAVKHDFTVELELAKQSTFSDWRLMRVANVLDVFNQIGIDYEGQIHAICAYSLAGMSNENVDAEMKEVRQQINSSSAAQNLFKKFNIRVKRD